MTYPTAYITIKGQEYECQVKDIHINGNRARCYIELDNYFLFTEYGSEFQTWPSQTSWVDFGSLDWDYPTTSEDVLNRIQQEEWSEQMRDEVPL